MPCQHLRPKIKTTLNGWPNTGPLAYVDGVNTALNDKCGSASGQERVACCVCKQGYFELHKTENQVPVEQKKGRS